MARRRDPYADQTTFQTPVGPVEVPRIPTATQVRPAKNALSQLAGEDAAAALSEILADPTGLVEALEADHLTLLDTPGGQLLRCVRAEVFIDGVSSNGANGRGVAAMFDRGRRASREEHNHPVADPWPLPGSGTGSELEYRVTNRERAAAAVDFSDSQIVYKDLITDIRQHPRGIWNPPVVCAAKFDLIEDEDQLERVQAIDGNTRVAAAKRITKAEPAGVIRAASVKEYLQEQRHALCEQLATVPDSADVREAAKVFVSSVLIVVDAVEHGFTPSTVPFHEVVSDYVRAIHLETVDWPDGSQAAARGEQLVEALNAAGSVSDEDAAVMIQRQDGVPPPDHPDVVAAQMVRLVTDGANETVRQVLLDDPSRERATLLKRSAVLTPLILRLFRDNPLLRGSAEAALSRGFIPRELWNEDWRATDRNISEVVEEAQTALEADPGEWSDASRELVARAGPALCVSGLILSDQGSAVGERSELRGPVDKVLEALAVLPGGIRLLGNVVASLEQGTVLPIQRERDGQEMTQDDGHGGEIPIRYTPAGGKANVDIRELAFVDEESEEGGEEGDADEEELTPEEAFDRARDEIFEELAAAVDLLERVKTMRAGDGQPFLQLHGFTPAQKAHGIEMTSELLGALHRFGRDEEGELGGVAPGLSLGEADGEDPRAYEGLRRETEGASEFEPGD